MSERKQGFQSAGYIDHSYLQGINEPNVRVMFKTPLNFLIVWPLCSPTQINFRAIKGASFSRFCLKLCNHDCHFVSCQGRKYQAGLQRSLDQNITYHQGSGSSHRQTCGQLIWGYFGSLFYRQLENEKNAALKFHRGNFDESMVLSPTAESDLQWWVENIENVSKLISQGNPSYTLNTDASLQGWGAVFQGQSSGGHWAPD